MDMFGPRCLPQLYPKWYIERIGDEYWNSNNFYMIILFNPWLTIVNQNINDVISE
jgi:hypothetical protein